MSNLVESHGEMVVKGKVAASTFVKGFSTRMGSNSYFDGTWDELCVLTVEHFADSEPGTGSVDGDVLLINVPADRFYCAVTEITAENEHMIEEIEQVRAEGEAPYKTRVLRGKKQPAKTAQIVVYRADVLAQDDDRSSDAEWEIVSVNAGPGYHVPMSPTTMARNENHEAGGTKRTYTAEQWAESIAFWQTHVSIIEE